jgi:Fur family ferric uptake transcriptional regulator
LIIDCALVRKHHFKPSTLKKVLLYVKQHDHIIVTDTGEVIEFYDPRIQNHQENDRGNFYYRNHESLLYLMLKRLKRNSENSTNTDEKRAEAAQQ